MFHWAAASSASLARLSMKFSFVCFYAFLDCPVCLCSLFLGCCFSCSRSTVVNYTFIFLPHLHFTDSVSRDSLLILSLFFPRISLHVLVHVSFICGQWVSKSMFSSPRRSSYLFLIVSRTVSDTSLSFRKSVSSSF